MASSSGAPPASLRRAALETLAADLTRVFGGRLLSLVAYGVQESTGDALRTLALVKGVTFEDLKQAVPLARSWQRLGLSVPLILTRDEFFRTLDVFPLEYGSIIDNHVVVAGANPFEGADIAHADRRRACEQQAKSHLIHLREGFLETEGDPARIAGLIAASVPAFRALLTHIVRLEASETAESGAHLAEKVERVIGVPATLVVEILNTSGGVSTIADPTLLLSRYVEASERIWRFVDGWRS